LELIRIERKKSRLGRMRMNDVQTQVRKLAHLIATEVKLGPMKS
jgi:hypothetical protein